jgi:hypothetical protein
MISQGERERERRPMCNDDVKRKRGSLWLCESFRILFGTKIVNKKINHI